MCADMTDFNDEFYKIKYQNRVYIKEKLLNDGSFGRVFSYRDIIGDNSIAVKYFKKPSEYYNEQYIHNIIQQENLSYLFPEEVYFDDEKRILIMTKMNGDLHELVERIPLTNLEKYTFLKQIFEGVYTLYTKNIYFTDIKLENVLYKYQKDKDGKEIIQLKFGDFGGMSDDRYHINSTYKRINDVETVEQKLINHLGILILRFIACKDITRIKNYNIKIVDDLTKNIKPFIKIVYDETKSEEEKEKIYKYFHIRFMKFFNDKIEELKNEN